MKKITSLLLAAALFLTVLLALAYTPYRAGAFADETLQGGRSTEARRVASAPTIDGDLADWPAVAGLTLDTATAQYSSGAIQSPLDLSASTRATWDSAYLYLAAAISDSLYASDSSNIWDDDSIEIGLDGNHDRLCCGAGDHQYSVSADGRLADFGAITTAPIAGIGVAVRRASGGYTVEMAIPLTKLTSLPVTDGAVMGFDIGLNDDDDGGRRDKRLVWSGNSTVDFGAFAEIVFTSGAAPTPAATASPSAKPTGSPTRTPTSSSAPTATPSASATPQGSATATPSTTPTAPGPGTPSAGDRLNTLDGDLSALEAQIAAMLDILKEAGYFPASSPTPTATGAPPTPTPTRDPVSYLQGVNAGGLAYTAMDGAFYAADQPYAPAANGGPGGWGFSGGQTYQIANDISLTEDDLVYQTERYNFAGYVFDVPIGVYSVTLRFAEIYQYAIPGGRVFDIRVEDSVVATHVDIFSRVGLFTAYNLVVSAPVYDGQLNIELVPRVGVPKISALYVVGVGAVAATPTPSLQDRANNITRNLVTLESLVAGMLDVFRSALPGGGGTPTPTQPASPPATPTRTKTPSGATATPSVSPTLGAPTPTLPPTRTATGTRTRTATGTSTRTPTQTGTATATITPGGPTLTPTNTATPSGGATRTATPTLTGSPKTSAKKGVGRGWGVGATEQLAQLGVSWSYSWGLSAKYFADPIEHVPMIWGKDYNVETVADLASTYPGRSWLIWNEPDYWQQANIAPAQAAQIYRGLRSLIKGVDPTARLIVGGVYNLNLGWLTSFRNEYWALYGEWPVVEGWHVHYYRGPTDYNSALWRQDMDAVRTWMAANGGTVEVWLTEFGSLNSDAAAAQIMQEQVPWLDAQPWVTRYAWFATYANGPGCPSCTGSLLQPDALGGALSDLGVLYRNLP